MASFKNIWDRYPNSDPCDAMDHGKKLYSSQCAIRLSHALDAAGVDLSSFSGDRCKVHPQHILDASALAKWVGKHLSEPTNITGSDWNEHIAGQTGIVCFEDYWARAGETTNRTGDHIDLWNGSRLTGLLSWFRVNWHIVVDGTWSDFGKSRRITFFRLG